MIHSTKTLFVHNRDWVFHSLKDLAKKEESKTELIRFWTHFYNCYESSQMYNEHVLSKPAQYKQKVFEILNNGKARLPLSDEELYNIQMEIEDLTMTFDEESMFKSAPNIIKKLIRNDMECAKDYLRNAKLKL